MSTYSYQADNLITLAPDPSAPSGTTYVNEGRVHAKGLEVEAQMRLRGGLQALTSYALQRAEDVDTGKPLVNSPQQIGKARLSVPGPLKGSIFSVEVLSLSSRQTIGGFTLKPATTASITAIVPIRNAFEIVGTIRNLFGVQYADPASDAHQQDSIPQNGRTLRIGLHWKVGAK